MQPRSGTFMFPNAAAPVLPISIATRKVWWRSVTSVSYTHLDVYKRQLLENRERVYYAIGYQPEFDRQVLDWINRVRDKARTGVRAPTVFIALEQLLHEMRLCKEPEEIAVMRLSLIHI